MIIIKNFDKKLCVLSKTRQRDKKKYDFVVVAIGEQYNEIKKCNEYLTIETDIECIDDCTPSKWRAFFQKVCKSLDNDTLQRAFEYAEKIYSKDTHLTIREGACFTQIERYEENGNCFCFCFERNYNASTFYAGSVTINDVYYCIISKRTATPISFFDTKSIDEHLKYGDLSKAETWRRINDFVLTKLCLYVCVTRSIREKYLKAMNLCTDQAFNVEKKVLNEVL